MVGIQNGSSLASIEAEAYKRLVMKFEELDRDGGILTVALIVV